MTLPLMVPPHPSPEMTWGLLMLYGLVTLLGPTRVAAVAEQNLLDEFITQPCGQVDVGSKNGEQGR